ncbi:pyridoxamine 5'-phosphate oxidase family protein, partial [Streptomyces sp. NPDC020125]|uniref:pyridoxamine 5'-phosphate oxidase family protein n=1 Tax=Streptomyces sp. NPDC020125 TaxID=3154593 RepID=UPI0033E3E69E
MDSAEHLDDRAWRPGSDGEHLLQRRLDTVDRADRFYDDQVLDHLNARMREFIDRQEMFFLATADGHGECDNTFRAGPPGFLRVLDARTLAYPEYRGNGVLASLGNIQENPHVGIIMVDFFRDRIGLHVNGRARVVEDAEMREAHPGLPVDPVPGRRAVVWVEVTVEEAYIHCAKHIPHLQKVPAQRRTGGGDNRHRGPSGDQAIEHDRERDWGTDDVKRKGGDFFGAAAEARDGRRTPPTPPTATAPTPQPAVPPGQPAPVAPVAPAVRVLLAPPVPYAPVVPGTQTLAMAAVSGPQTPVTPAAPAVPGLQTPPVPYAPVVPGPRALA